MKKLLMCLAAFAFVACGKAPEPAQPAATDKPAAAPAAAPAEPAKAPEPVKAPEPAAGLTIAKYNLKMDLPADATVQDLMGSLMIQAPGVVVTLKEAGESDPKTADDQKKESSMYTPKNEQTEALPDGWVYTFENTGDAGTNYWVVISRAIGGKTFRCETTSSTPEQQANAVKACKSLKP